MINYYIKSGFDFIYFDDSGIFRLVLQKTLSDRNWFDVILKTKSAWFPKF